MLDIEPRVFELRATDNGSPTGSLSLAKPQSQGLEQKRHAKAMAKEFRRVDDPNKGTVIYKSRNGDRYWEDEEHLRFIAAVRLFGKDWAAITAHIGTRSRQSVWSHAQKFVRRVQKEPNLEGADCARILASRNDSRN